jgi:hypothetical protein
MDFVQNCRLRSFSDGLHLDSTWTYGVQVDSIWNLWGRVNYTLRLKQPHPPIVPTRRQPPFIELQRGDGRVLWDDTVQDSACRLGNVTTRSSDPSVARIGIGGEERLDGGVSSASWNWQTKAVWPCKRARHSLLCNRELHVGKRKKIHTQ